MCESHSFYALCGHLKIKTVVQCPEAVEATMNQVEAAQDKHRVCTDVVDSVHVFPDLCEKCHAVGMVGEFIQREPTARFHLLSSWKAAERKKAQRGDSDISTEDTGADENMEFIAPSEVLSSESSITSSPGTPPTESAEAMLLPKPTDLKDIKARVEALKIRMEKLVVRIRSEKAAREARVQHSN